MPATVNVNNLTVVHKDSGGMSFSFPDVCNTPSPGGPVPVPYPNIAMSKDTSRGSQQVKIDGNPVMLKGSVISTSTGDEAGSAGGVVSGVTKGNAEFTNYSFDVKIEGKNVCRLLDTMAQNKNPCTGNGMGPAIVQPPIVSVPVPLKVQAKKELTASVFRIKFDSGIDLWTADKTKAIPADVQIPPAASPHWESGGAKYPACYVRDNAAGVLRRNLTVTLKIKTELSGEAKLWLKAPTDNPVMKIEGKKAVNAGPNEQTVVFDCTFTKLPETVRLLKDWNFNFTLELGGQTRKLPGPSLTLYIIDEQPKIVTWNDPNHNWYDWVLEYSCKWADGVTGADKVFAAIWNKFSDGTGARIPHATGWSYWATDDCAQNLLEIPGVASTKGWSCRGICHFFMMSAAVHGLGCEDVVIHGRGDYGFIVAHWDLNGSGDKSPFPPAPGWSPRYYCGDWTRGLSNPKRKVDKAGWVVDAKRDAHVGQGQSNPPLVFGNHWILDMKSGPAGLYDTSYGGNMINRPAGAPASLIATTELPDYQAVAISGWVYPMGDYSVVIIQNNRGTIEVQDHTGHT